MLKRLGHFVTALIMFMVTGAFWFVVALYLGVWMCYVGSVVDFIDQCKSPETSGAVILWCLFRFFVLGSVVCAVGVGMGLFSAGVGSIALASAFKPSNSHYR